MLTIKIDANSPVDSAGHVYLGMQVRHASVEQDGVDKHAMNALLGISDLSVKVSLVLKCF